MKTTNNTTVNSVMSKYANYLLAILLLIGTCISAWGKNVSFSYTDLIGQGSSGSGSAFDGASRGSITIGGSGNGNTTYVQIYAGGTLTFTPIGGATITKIVLTATTAGYAREWSANTGEVSVSEATITWDGSSTSAVTLTNTETAQARITDMAVSYTPGTTYDVKWYVGGAIHHHEANAEPVLTLPDDVDDDALGGSCTGYTFMGWSETNIGSSPTNTRPTLFMTPPTISTDKIYYAVFADCSDENAWEITEIDNINSGTGYAAYNGSHTADGINYTSSNVMEQSSLIQFQSNSGYLFNTTNFSNDITRIVITSESSFWSVYTDDEEINSTPGSGALSVSSISTTRTYWATSANQTYFHIKGGDGTPKASSIKVYYGTISDYRTECDPCTANPSISGASIIGDLASGGVTSLTDLADLFAVSGSSKGDTYCSYSENGFVWSSTAANATALQKGGSGVNYITGTEPDVSGAYTGSLSETLTAGTTYYYRAYVKNNGDIVKYYPADNILSFTPQSVTFNSNGGSSVATIYVNNGATINQPSNPTKSGFVFGGWYTDNTTFEEAVDWDDAIDENKIYYAKWMTYTDYVFSCAELSLTGPTADLVFITSAASKTVRSQEAFHIEGNGLTPGATVTFSFGSTALDAIFKMKKADGTAPTVSNPGGTIDVDVYVYYTPTGTTDGLDQATNLTATVAGAKPKKATLNTKTIIGRHLPANFVIAAKFADNKWYALPANKATGNLTPVPIRVNSESAPTTAYCEKTNSFTLYQDNTSNSPKVILGLTNYKNDKDVSYALFGSSSGSTIGKSDGTVTGSIADQYKWTLAQQATSVSGIGDVKYLINVTNNARPLALRTYSGSTTWGLHPASGVRDTLMRLLTLQEVQPMSLKVMEWGTDAIVVSYPNGGSASGVQAAIGDASPSSVTMTSLGGDIYKISTISGLQSNPSKPLYIMATESGTSKQAVVTIPLIVTASKTEAQLRESLPGATADIRNATAKYIDVIIRNGGTMTTGTGSGNFADLYIYPGGKAIVSNNMSFGTIYMRGGYSFLDNKATYRYPDLCVKSGTMTTSGLKYDLYIDNRYYYTFSMPYDVTLASVKDEAGNEDFPVWVKHYNGATRASGTHVSGWEWYGDNPVTQHSFFAGVGYEITAKPKVSGRPIAIIRFPVKSGNITSDASREIGVSVGNYGYDDYESGSLAANNVGWNFVGNPYLTEYKAGTASPANDTLMIVAQGYVQHIDPTTGVWDGTYDWQASNKRFITVPYDTQSDYHSEYVATYTIPAFSAFFIQTETEGTFYMRGTRPQAAGVAPRYMQAQREKPEVHLDVLLRGDNEAVEAKAGLIIHDKYEGGLKDFEDVEQWFVDQNEQKTYTFASGTALAYNLTNEQAAAQVIPMGYIATVAGEHVYSISESNDVSRLVHLWLTDNETGMTTDLLVRDYTFTTDAGRYDERFTITAEFEREEVYTDVTDTGGNDWVASIGVYHDGNTLTLRGLPENSAVYVYDMTGKLMASDKQLNNVVSLSIAAQGVYNIRVVNGQNAVTLRSVIR